MRLITCTYVSQGHIYTNILMECQLTFSLRKKLLQHDLLCISSWLQVQIKPLRTLWFYCKNGYEVHVSVFKSLLLKVLYNTKLKAKEIVSKLLDVRKIP